MKVENTQFEMLVEIFIMNATFGSLMHSYSPTLLSVLWPLLVLFQTKSRDHDARDYYKARRQYRLISDDLLSKDVQIEDTKKRIKELEVKLADFAAAYEVHCKYNYHSF